MTIKAKEIVDQVTLRAWLKTRSIEDARVIAARVALRAIPLIFAAENFDDEKNYIVFQSQMLVNFRAAFITCAAIKFPSLDMKSAAFSTTDFVATIADAATDVNDFIVSFVSHTSAFSIFVSHALQPDKVTAASANAVGSAATASEYAITNTAYSSDVATQVWQEVRNDAFLLELGNSVFETVLESNRETDLSIIRTALLQTTRSAIGFSRDGSDGKWGLWLDWYEYIIPDQRKSLFGEEADVELATQDDEFWQGDPNEVMERVAALVGWPRPKDESGDLDQRPAPHSFELRNGQIHAYPLNASPINSDAAEDMRSEIVDKAKELHERLQRTQAPQRVSDTVDRLLASLGNNISDVKPGIFLSRSRSLEADILQFQTEQARDEMATDALSMMVDLGACVDDLKGMLPTIADIEANRIALKLADGAAIDALNFASEITEIAEKSEIIALSSIEALKHNNPDIQEASEVIESSNDDVVVAEAIKIQAKLIANKLQDVRNFSASLLKNTGGAVGRGAIKGLETGTEKVVSAAIIAGVAILFGGIAGPLAGLAVLVASFFPLGKRAKEVSDKDDDDLTDDQTDV